MNRPGLKIRERIDRLLQVNHPDPDVARRGRLLNILLLGGDVTAIVSFSVGLIANIADGWTHPDEILLVVAAAIMLVFASGLYFLYRAGFTRLVPVIFLLGMLILLSLSDEPRYLIGGRSMVAFVLPVVMASVLLAPASSFLFVGLVSVDLIVIAQMNGLSAGPVVIAAVIFSLAALVSWLSARSLETALAELRKINAELDRRVADRTKQLAEALIDVQLESGKNQAILESIADGVIVFDESGKAVVTNPAISLLLDRTQDKLLGYSISDLMEGRADLGDNTQRLPNLKFQWGSKTVSASFAPVRMSGTGSSGMVAVFRDFTREAEIDRMKSTFVSMVSHELRTPLSAIIGYTEMLLGGVYGNLDEKQTGIVSRLDVNAKRLMRLVGDLLDRAQLEAGKMIPRIATFLPRKLVDETLSPLVEQAQAKGLALIWSIGENLPMELLGDEHRLQQVMVNLVTNAIKFTEKGRIRVDISRPDAEHWQLVVSDTGIGIPASEQSHLFESFRQVDSTATRQHAGFGLGLSIVKQLVALMGGEISLSSQLGQGSTFAVILPLVVQLPKEKTE